MSAKNILKEYNDQKQSLINILGEKKYNDELEILKKVGAQED